MTYALTHHNQAVEAFMKSKTAIEKMTIAMNYFEKAEVVDEKSLVELNKKEYPPLLNATHVSEILSCHRTTAYEIMREPHRPVWKNGKKIRMHRDLFFQQLQDELRIAQ